MCHHIYRHSINIYRNIGAMVAIKATYENLFCFSATLMLGDK